MGRWTDRARALGYIPDDDASKGLPWSAAWEAAMGKHAAISLAIPGLIKRVGTPRLAWLPEIRVALLQLEDAFERGNAADAITIFKDALNPLVEEMATHIRNSHA